MADDCRIRCLRAGPAADDAAGVMAVWNQGVDGHHGFFPLSLAIFQRRIIMAPRFCPQRLLVAEASGEIVGFLHYDEVREAPYEPAMVIEAICVLPHYRQRGIGSALLAAALRDMAKAGTNFIDGGGAWPYSPFYATLIDGSERSGLFQSNAAAVRLFARHGFVGHRASIVMHCDLAEDIPRPPLPPGLHIREERRAMLCCWLDFVFRGWRLTDHDLCDNRGRPLTRAIYARMDGLSDHVGREIYAVFGVHTDEGCRRRGLAFANLAAMLSRIRSLGATEAELHVYADNTPAVNLYRKLGFRDVAHTLAMRFTDRR